MENLDHAWNRSIHKRKQVTDVFQERYSQTISPDDNRWERCARVLARADVVDRLSQPW